MNSKTVFISLLPAILFFSGIIFFAYSSLTISKIVSVQNEVFILFFQELEGNEILSAMITTFEYFFTNVLWIVLIFLILITFGFLVYLYYFKEVEFRVVVISQIMLIIIVLISTDFSITMTLVSISLLLGMVWMRKTFEPEKKAFSTGYSVIASRVGLVGIFLAVGILASLLVHMEAYEEEMMATNMDLMKNFMPDMSEAKQAQKDQIGQITDGIKYALTERYNALSGAGTECSVLYEGLTDSLDAYKEQTSQKIDEQELVVTEDEIMQISPLFGLIVKATPIIIAISVYALIALLTPLMGFIGGIVYSLVKKS